MTPEKNPWDAETVYALLQHVDEATYVRGIFSTKEKAQRAQNDLTGESKYEDDLIQKRLPSRSHLGFGEGEAELRCPFRWRHKVVAGAVRSWGLVAPSPSPAGVGA